jgi:hypothetical protein
MTGLSPTPNSDSADAAPRRGLFARFAAVTMVGFAGLMPLVTQTQAEAATNDGPNWPGRLKGRHRQVVDAYEVNGGFPLAFAYTFLTSNTAGTATSVVILRHIALVMALKSDVWAKYKIGSALKITDPETTAPATKNPFLEPKPGVLLTDEMAVDRLLAKGAVFGACDVALHALSSKLAPNAGTTPDVALKEWHASVIAGITVLPSGVWGLNRAQEAGCTYCTGGG